MKSPCENDSPKALASCNPIRQTKMVEELLARRLLRKSIRVLELWENADRDWNQTLYEMAAYAMGAPRNRGPFQTLAKVVTRRMCARESGSAHGVEALLLGASGLLDGKYSDDYFTALKNEYDYLATKYSLTAMPLTDWDFKSPYLASSPVVRVAQFAAFVGREQFSFDQVLACEKVDDVAALLSVDLGDYWCKKYRPKRGAGVVPRRLSKEKVVVMTINFVVPLQCAYAEVMHRPDIKQRASGLLESLPAEHNRIVSRWTEGGFECTSAYMSQALIELQSYCDGGLCEECPLAKEIKRA